MSRNIKSSAELVLSDSYELKYEGYVSDCKACGVVLKHKKSGARICILSNDDENKAFAIAFRTPPCDDTGVAHIIEHSVLCGSKKFPAKDPFMELAKGSLNTFLNAITFPDKTCYPVASCNDKDLANLMDVYMDAVLNPLMYEHEEIFKQEGWHYEINSPEEPVTINGVVYSEMKGAFSSPENKLSREVLHAMFPDTSYGVESGGNPKSIPSLTYQNFLDFHKKYYHPSNSYIYLYGDLDIEERLDWLDREYLSKYDYQPVDSEIRLQTPTVRQDIVDYYSIADEEPDEDATYLNWSRILGECSDIERDLAIDIICDCLFNVPGAPIRERLIGCGIGQDLNCGVDNSIRQSSVNLTVQNSNPDKMAELQRILSEELEKACTEGLNRDTVIGCINRREFNYAEADFGFLPKGLMYIINSSTTWLYDDEAAFLNVNRSVLYDSLRKKLDSGYFEQLIRKYLLDGDNDVFYTMIPKYGYGSEEEKLLEKQLFEFKNQLGENGILGLIEENRKLKEFQSEPSSREALEALPLLTRDDLKKEPSPIICEDRKIGKYPVKYHNVDTNNIVYLRLFFDIDKLDRNQIQASEMLCKLFGNMNTQSRSYLEYNNDVNIHTGGLSTYMLSFGDVNDQDYYRPLFCTDAKFMAHELDNCLKLISELLLTTDISDIKRVRDLLGETKARMKATFSDSGHVVAKSRMMAELNSYFGFEELTDGISYYRFVCNVLEMSDTELEKLIEKCSEIREIVIGKDNCFIDITCNEEIYDKVAPALAKMLDGFDDAGVKEGNHCGPYLKFEKSRCAFKTSGTVNFLCVGGKIRKMDPKTSGIMNVVRNMISSEYLWNNVRMLGGAYGSGFSANAKYCTGSFYSYRDPNLKNTYEIFEKTPEFVKNYSADDREILKAVIGTIGGMDMPLNPSMKGEVGLMMNMEGVTDELRKKKREAIINASLEDIKEVYGVIEDIFRDPSVCAVAGEGSLAKEGDMFEHIESLF